MKMIIREYQEKDLCEMIEIWNEIVEEGNAFPQEELLNLESARNFFAVQTYTGVAIDTQTRKILCGIGSAGEKTITASSVLKMVRYSSKCVCAICGTATERFNSEFMHVALRIHHSKQRLLIWKLRNVSGSLTMVKSRTKND